MVNISREHGDRSLMIPCIRPFLLYLYVVCLDDLLFSSCQQGEWTLLIRAAGAGQSAIVEKLLLAGAKNMEATDRVGNLTPIAVDSCR